jgi:hypothetical protein
MARVPFEADDTPSQNANRWHAFEAQEWVKAEREHGLSISKLDDHEIKMSAYAELNRQLVAEGAPVNPHPEMR